MRHEERTSETSLNLAPRFFRRFTGPEACEFFLLCRPPLLESGDMLHQTRAAYRILADTLDAEGGSLGHVVQETVFFRNIQEDLPAFLKERQRVLGELVGDRSYRPASTFIEEPPLDARLRLEISASAVVPHRQDSTFAWNVSGTSPCGCEICSQLNARVFLLGDEEHLYAGNVYGAPGSAYREAYSLFEAAEGLLRQEGMDFRHVIRTWIHLRHMERDYADLNRARRRFFEERSVERRPASTGIQGAPFPEEHNFSLSLYAIKAPGPLAVERMTSPTLNEAWTYGSDFSRGLRVVEANKEALYVSGTASVDEAGLTAHRGDFQAQVERTLLNVSALLAAQNASWRDVVSAVTYLKRPADAPRLRRILHQRGLDGFPHALVEAPVCRPDLLCEMEALAVLPLSRPAGGTDPGEERGPY